MVTIATHDFKCKVNGEEVTVKIKTDLTWGETQDLLSKSVRQLENGQKDFNFNNFCDVLLSKTIISGLPFPATNLVKMKDLPMSEISIILGEIIENNPFRELFQQPRDESSGNSKTVEGQVYAYCALAFGWDKFTVDKLPAKYVLDTMFISMQMLKDVIGGVKLR